MYYEPEVAMSLNTPAGKLVADLPLSVNLIPVVFFVTILQARILGQTSETLMSYWREILSRPDQ